MEIIVYNFILVKSNELRRNCSGCEIMHSCNVQVLAREFFFHVTVSFAVYLLSQIRQGAIVIGYQ